MLKFKLFNEINKKKNIKDHYRVQHWKEKMAINFKQFDRERAILLVFNNLIYSTSETIALYLTVFSYFISLLY